jgi:hypothetical protein
MPVGAFLVTPSLPISRQEKDILTASIDNNVLDTMYARLLRALVDLPARQGPRPGINPIGVVIYLAYNNRPHSKRGLADSRACRGGQCVVRVCTTRSAQALDT